VALGHSAGDSITTGGCNITIGGAAGASITTTCENVLIGDLAGSSTTGCKNVAVGTSALCVLTAGDANAALGNYAGRNILTGSCNVAIGNSALGSTSAGVTGGANIAIGASGLPNLTSGAGNIVIGAASGQSITTTGCNLIFGNSTTAAATHQFTTLIGNGYTSTQSCQVILGFSAAGTTASFNQGAAAWSFSSDARRKDDIEDLSEGLALVEKLQPRKYDFKALEDGEAGTPAFGLVAQEVLEAIKGTDLEGRGLVGGDEENGYNLAYASLVVVLINAVKELSAEIKALKGE
jgi:hypothetical protein